MRLQIERHKLRKGCPPLTKKLGNVENTEKSPLVQQLIPLRPSPPQQLSGLERLTPVL